MEERKRSSKNLAIYLRVFMRRLVRFFRFNLRFLIGLFLAILILLLVAQHSATQTWAAQKAAAYLSERIGFDVQIEKLFLSDIDKIGLLHVQMRDRTNHTFIKADTIHADISLRPLIAGEGIIIDYVELMGGEFNMVKNPETNKWNISELIQAFKALSGKKDSTKKKTPPSPFKIKKAIVHNCQFSFNNASKDSLKNGQFDYNHFTINRFSGEVDHFRLQNDSLEINLRKGSLIEPFIQFPVKNIDVFFRYTLQSMEFLNLDLKVGKSHLKESITLRYENIDSLAADFINNVDIEANLKQSTVYFEDIARFAPSLKKYNERFTATGLVTGRISDMRSQDLRVSLGKGTYLHGRAQIRGLPEVESSFWDLRIKKARLLTTDLRKYISSKDYEFISPLTNVKFEGSFLGFTSDFVAKGTFISNLGNATTDIHLNTTDETYQGELRLSRFDVGALSRSSSLGKLTASGKIDGKGFTKNKANFRADADVKEIELLHYPYQNIKVDGTFNSAAFNGDMTVEDKNLIASLNGMVNLEDSIIKGKIRLTHSDLRALGFSKSITSVRGNGDFDLKGFTLNDIEGTADVRQAYLKEGKNDFKLSSISLSSRRKGDFRTIHLDSDYLRADILGVFKLGNALDDAKNTFEEFRMALMEDSLQRHTYYQTKRKNIAKRKVLDEPYQINYEIKIKEINPLVRLFQPSFYISPNAVFDGVFIKNEDLIFNLDAHVDSLSYQDISFFKSDIQIDAQKPYDSVGVNATINISSKRQYVKQNFNGENLRLHAQWKDRQIFFDSFVKRQHADDKASIEGEVALTDSLYDIRLIKPSFWLLGNEWKSDTVAHIAMQKEKLVFKDKLIVESDSQHIEVFGEVSKNPNAYLEVNLNNVNLHQFGEFVGEDLEGTANGKAIISGVYDTLKVENNLDFLNVIISKIKVGDLHTNSAWDTEKQQLKIDASLNYGRREVVDITGVYAPNDKESPLNLDAKIIGMRLNVIEPFLNQVADNFKGAVYGAVKIKGKPQQPLLIGEAYIDGGGFRVDYLNTYYHFDDKVVFTPFGIGVDRLRIYDDNENIGFVDGGIYHKGFRDFVLQLTGEMNNLKVLDTPADNGEPLYGIAYATGDFKLAGALDEQLTITINAKSEAGTKIYLPLSDPEDVSSQSFIRFVSHSEGGAKKDSLRSRLTEEDFSSLKMEFNLDVTPDAYVELIFDKKVGDVIRGNADGKLQMFIDTKGDFTMYGDVKIVKGAYNFTFLNVINKEFGVSPGSHIAWSGDPYQAKVDLIAKYQQMASLAPIITTLDSAVLNRPELKRRYPVVVDLFLRGDLLSPKINFDINVRDYPSLIMAGTTPVSLESHVAAFKSRIQNDEQEMNKQVFSLILLRRLSAQNSFTETNSTAGSSVSELLSNQLSYLVSQIDENFEVDLNVQGLNADALNTLQLRLSYKFFEGRMRVTREGAFTNAQNQTSLASIAGDWTVEYFITPDGNLRMKAYHKNNVNAFNTAIQNNSTAGVGLLRIFTFDSFKDLFKRKRRKKHKVPYVLDDEIQINEN